jgi:hypothetical protein
MSPPKRCWLPPTSDPTLPGVAAWDGALACLGGLLSLSPAAYISAKSLPLPAAGGVRSSATDRRSTMVAAGAGDLGDGFVPAVAYVALPADELSGAVCADVGGMAMPTLGYTTPTADVVLDDGLLRLRSPSRSFRVGVWPSPILRHAFAPTRRRVARRGRSIAWPQCAIPPRSAQ